MVCDDDACGNLESLVTWVTQPGVTYYLQLGRSGLSAGGTGSFTLDFQLPPANDDCGAAIDLGSTSGAAYDNTLGSTGVHGQGNPGCTDVQKDLWYRWTATQNGTATLDTCGQTGDDTALAVYAGAGCPRRSRSAATTTAADRRARSPGRSRRIDLHAAGRELHVRQRRTRIVQHHRDGSGFTGTPECFGDTAAACPCSGAGGT
jgi:hypothetical protein